MIYKTWLRLRLVWTVHLSSSFYLFIYLFFLSFALEFPLYFAIASKSFTPFPTMKILNSDQTIFFFGLKKVLWNSFAYYFFLELIFCIIFLKNSEYSTPQLIKHKEINEVDNDWYQ